MFDTFVSKGVEPIRWLLVAGIAYTLATTIWTFFDTPAVSANASNLNQSASVANTQASAQKPGNVNWILTKHMFGKAGAAPVAAETSNEPAVQTRLPLELRMVVVADDPQESSAMVAQRGKPGLLYTVGEKLPGNAELIEVHSDRIILRRAGAKETLMFPKTKSQFVAQQIDEGDAQASASSSRARAANKARIRQAASSANKSSVEEELDPEELVAEYQDKLANDADGTLDELGIETVDSGGYRIGNSAQSSYLRQTGLQPGDVILSVNGRPVGDIQQDQLELENVMAQGSARIEVQRGSRRFFVTASLK